MRAIIFPIIIAVLSGCSTLNIFKGPDDYYKNYYLGIIRDSIDKALADEADKKSPNGYLTQPYSRTNWNKYWNSRIYYLYELGSPSTPSSYKGPTGQEFIKYLIQIREKAGLPQLELEERNIKIKRGRFPLIEALRSKKATSS